MTTWHPLPPRLFNYIEQTPGSILLHSSRPGESPFSRYFTSPQDIFRIRKLEDLPSLFASIEEAVGQGLFVAGYFTYECAQYFEPTVPARTRRDSDLLAYFAVYESCHVFDHRVGTFDCDPPFATPLPRESRIHKASHLPDLSFRLSQQQFTSRIDQIHDWIRAGDVYQLNFTFPLRAEFIESPSELYARLTVAQPVEYGAFLHTEHGHHILSFSPELFFRIDQNRRITARPMKGTAPRGRTTSEDHTIAEWLSQDSKNRAENVMIVDLIRNDLGRICSFGSVHVENLFQVERFPSLWQMTSSISGNLRPEVSCEDIVRALFPCGSITGAPKVRAMQLLAKIEEEARGSYTGAIGFFSREATILNVAIRTLELQDGIATGGVGSGIVIDSEPDAEYRECRLKAEFLNRSAEEFSLIETMLWDGSFPFLEYHLDRLADSADYFDFRCDRAAIHDALLATASRFPGNLPRKARLLLRANGETHIESEPLPDSTAESGPLRVGISATRTNPADRFLFHKTTRRDLYNRANATARSSNLADLLFLNNREEVTECAVHNLFIDKSGRWYTPPLDCGVLPGVCRRHLLLTRPEIEEKILTLNDLKAADGVYICNAVRGLRRVTIDFEDQIEF
jgi:para-aminobenzoate synthetase/4-amino-4-deoxychorismate lyase